MQRIRELLGKGSAFPGKRRWSRWGICLSCLGMVSLGCGTVFLTGHGLRLAKVSLEELGIMPIERVEILGNKSVTKETVRNVAQIIEHKTGMLSLDTSRIAQELQKNPWIRAARIERNWPSGVTIHVEEESVFALIVKEDEKDALYYMNDKGQAFLAARPGSRLDFPVVTGLFHLRDETLRKRVIEDVLVFLRKCRENNPYLPVHSLSEIHLDPSGEMVLYLLDYPFPIFFGRDNVEKKYWRLVQILKPLYKSHDGKKKIEEVSYIQMEYLKDKVLVATAAGEE